MIVIKDSDTALHDRFASMALTGRLISGHMAASPDCTGERVARWCYEIADAMIAEREKRKQTRTVDMEAPH